jgi:hypothetical protein
MSILRLVCPKTVAYCQSAGQLSCQLENEGGLHSPVLRANKDDPGLNLDFHRDCTRFKTVIACLNLTYLFKGSKRTLELKVVLG